MFWRWQHWESFRVRIRERYRENQKAAANAVAHAFGDVEATPPPMSLVDVGRFVNASIRKQLVETAELTRVVPSSPRLVGSLAGQFETFARVSDFTRAMSSMTRMTDTTKLTHAFAGVRPESFAVRLPRAPDPGLTSVTRMSAGIKQWTSVADPVTTWDRTFGTASIASAALASLWIPEFRLGTASVSAAALAGVRMLGFPALGALGLFVRQTEEMRELDEAMDAVDRFERRWQTRTLSYLVLALLGCCTVWEAAKLAVLSDAEVEEVVLHAVEAVVCDGEFVPAGRTELKRAPLLKRPQRAHLDHMLEHALAREWLHASAPLYAGGLEGAYWAAGYDQLVVTDQRTLPHRPSKKVEFENMVKLLPVSQELKTLMTRGLYGAAGSLFRHGDADEGERRQVLLGIVALAGWFEHFANRPAFTLLIDRAAGHLPAALKLRETFALPPGGAEA